MHNLRRTHSSIDRLPADLRDTLSRMIIDSQWPSDYPGSGKPTYDELVTYCKYSGYEVSRSAIGRYAQSIRLLAKMKSANEIVKKAMKDITAEQASATQKAVAELITAQTIEFIADNESLTAKEINNIARAIKDCTQIAINADKYIREQLTEKVRQVAESTKKKLEKAGVNRKLIQSIIDEHLGVIKS